MKPILSVLLIAALLVPSTPASAKSAGPGWFRVKAVKAGSPVIVTLAGERVGRAVYLVHADDATLVLFDPVAVSLPRQAAQFLADLLSRHPERLMLSSGEVVENDSRLTPDALFYRGARLAAYTDIVRTVARTDVTEVVSPAKGASAAAVSSAVAAGAFIGYPVGMGALLSRCNGSCAGNAMLFFLAVIGLPVALGLLTARATRRDPETLYRA